MAASGRWRPAPVPPAALLSGPRPGPGRPSIVDHPQCGVQHGGAEHADDQWPEEPAGPVMALDELPGLLGGQQSGSDGYREPPGGLVDEAGELIPLCLGELDKHRLPVSVAALAAN